MENVDPTKVDIAFDPRHQRLLGRTNHDNLLIDVPYVTHLKDNLWQGGCANGLVLPDFFEHVFSMYVWEAYTILHDLKTYEEVVMYDDTRGFNEEEIVNIARRVLAASKDGPTLIHCQAGLNRSSLIAGTALWLDGMPSSEIVDFLREKRGSAVLCNPLFEKFVANLDFSGIER